VQGCLKKPENPFKKKKKLALKLATFSLKTRKNLQKFSKNSQKFSKNSQKFSKTRKNPTLSLRSTLFFQLSATLRVCYNLFGLRQLKPI
jgi:hypothetical protein